MAQFSQYASKFLNQALPTQSMSNNQQPLFYSMATGSDQLDDDTDPHLRRSQKDYDPFNLEDIPDSEEEEEEEEHQLDAARSKQGRDVEDELPLLLQSQSKWRRHDAPSPPRSPSTPSSSTGEEELSSRSASPPLNLDVLLEESVHEPQPPRAPGNQLTESLIPRGAFGFSLPAVGRTPRRRYHDVLWANVWFTTLGACGIGFILTLFLIKEPPTPPGTLLYSTLTHTIPLLTLFTLIAAMSSYLHLLLLRVAVAPVLMGTSVAVPAVMVIAALWAFAGSFFWTGKDSGWAETVGLRLFALVPLVLAGLSAKALYERRSLLQQTISVVTLTTRLLLQHTHLPLLAISPLILLVTLIISLPFLSLIFHLLLIGYLGHGEDWHLKPYAGWLITGAVAAWVWSWCIARDVLRVSVAGVIGSWYFTGDAVDGVETAQRAVYRAIGPLLGTNCLSALVLTGINVATFAITAVMRVTLPPAMKPLAVALTGPTNFAVKSMTALSSYALVYSGVSGESFFPSARRARALTSVRGMRSKKHYRLLTILLLLSAFAMGLLAAMGAYLFTAVTLGKPAHAPWVSFLGGGVTFLVGWFCLSLVDDVADTLYMCYCIDVDIGSVHKEEVFDAFEGRDLQATSRRNDARV